MKLDGDEPGDLNFDDMKDGNTWGSGDEGYGGDGFGNRVEATAAQQRARKNQKARAPQVGPAAMDAEDEVGGRGHAEPGGDDDGFEDQSAAVGVPRAKKMQIGQRGVAIRASGPRAGQKGRASARAQATADEDGMTDMDIGGQKHLPPGDGLEAAQLQAALHASGEEEPGPGAEVTEDEAEQGWEPKKATKPIAGPAGAGPHRSPKTNSFVAKPGNKAGSKCAASAVSRGRNTPPSHPGGSSGSGRVGAGSAAPSPKKRPATQNTLKGAQPQKAARKDPGPAAPR